MFWKKKKEKTETARPTISISKAEKKRFSILTIFPVDTNAAIGKIKTELSKEEAKIHPYIPFLKWYFGRPQSENYFYTCTNKDVLYIRKNIRTFSIEEIEE